MGLCFLGDEMDKQDDPGALANAFVIGWTLVVIAVKIVAASAVVAGLQTLGVREGYAYLGGAFVLWLLVSA